MCEPSELTYLAWRESLIPLRAPAREAAHGLATVPSEILGASAHVGVSGDRLDGCEFASTGGKRGDRTVRIAGRPLAFRATRDPGSRWSRVRSSPPSQRQVRATSSPRRGRRARTASRGSEPHVEECERSSFGGKNRKSLRAALPHENDALGGSVPRHTLSSSAPHNPMALGRLGARRSGARLLPYIRAVIEPRTSATEVRARSELLETR